MENEEDTVYEYYTIINDTDTYITSEVKTELEYAEADGSSNVMYLSVTQEDEDEEEFTSNIVLNEGVVEVENEEMPGNVELISIPDGSMYITDSSSMDGNFAAIDPEMICESENSLFLSESSGKAELSSSDNEGDYRKIELEDGTFAYIEKSLWNSLIDIGQEEEEKEEKTAYEKYHSKKRKYACTYGGCDKVYTTAHHLTVHIRNHTGYRPFQCTIAGCDKAFATGYSLKAHIRTHTGEAPYSCSVCPKQFKTSGDLQKHIRTHTGEKPFKCPIEGCGRSFTTSNIRKVHIRSHTGERPYACTYPDCGKAFASATNFKNHMRIHSGEKPYECSVQGCGKRFTEYSSLFKHNAVHKPFKSLKCEYCDQLCKHETTLRAHKQAMHKILIADDGSEIRLTTKEY